MNILTIDTATELLGVSLTTESGQYYEHNVVAGLQHTERLMPIVASLLQEAALAPEKLDLLVCAKGPGSFTGLRIGMSTAKGLRQATEAPIVSIPTLDALAYPFSWFRGAVVPVLDARKSRVYAAVYHGGTRVSDYLDIPAGEIPSLVKDAESVLIVGTSEVYAQQTAATIPKSIPVRANGSGRAYASLGVTTLTTIGADPQDAGPLYIRKSDAQRNREGK